MRSVRVVVLLCVGFAASVRADDGTGQYSGVTGAALEALRGHGKQAKATLTSGKGDRADPAALVVLASIALDEGSTREAARLVARLRAVAPGASEGRLLDALVNERLARPRGDWITAGLTAVEKVQPLATSRPLVPLWERPLPFPEEAAAKLSPADRFLARWAWSWQAGKNTVVVGEAVRMALSDERPLVLLAALDVLESAAPNANERPRDEDIATAHRAVLAKLQGTPAGRLRFVGLPPRTEAQPVDEEEIAAIAASVADADAPSFGPNYSELMRILDKLDPATAPEFAQGKPTLLLVPPGQLLQIRDRAARSKLSADAGERLAAALVRYAERQQREGLLITDGIAAVFLWHASILRNDPVLRARREAIHQEVESLRNASRCLYPLLALPIPSMQRAWAEQRPRERAFLEQAARRGLSCPEPKPRPENVDAPANTEPRSPCPDPAAAVTR
jgi:hypothetical protein